MKSLKHYRLILIALVVAGGLFAAAMAQQPGQPRVVVETSKGTVTFELFAKQAPISVEHITKLIKNGFYNGQRVHRVAPNFVVQFGDPRSRDVASRDLWGRGAEAGSGEPVGVAEIDSHLTHDRGTVALAHPGTPAEADSQIYITLAPRPDLNGRYAVIGQVIDGDDVLDRLAVGDLIESLTLEP